MSITVKAAVLFAALPDFESDRPCFILRTPVGPPRVDSTRSVEVCAAWAANSNGNRFVRLSQLGAPAADQPQDAGVCVRRRERALAPELEAKEIRS